MHVVQAHPANCICIEFDPTGQFFATGSADALVSLWDANEIACLRTFARLHNAIHGIVRKYNDLTLLLQVRLAS